MLLTLHKNQYGRTRLILISAAFVLWTFCVGLIASSYRLTAWHELESKQYNFEQYVEEYGKVYESESEYHMRKAIFHENIEVILSFNRGDAEWKMGVNHLTDRNKEEFAHMRGYKAGFSSYVHQLSDNILGMHEPTGPIEKLPKQVDWRARGAVTAVKDQQQCGSCWAFGTSEVLESFYIIETGRNITVSAQQIASCTEFPIQCQNVGTGGCEGGSPLIALHSAILQNNTATEQQYPYVSGSGQDFPCRNIKQRSDLYIQGSRFVRPNNYGAFMDALANRGPLAIVVDASNWQSYESGIVQDTTTNQLDHVVQAVGYGSEKKADGTEQLYWIVRNSWSSAWGENGYIRYKRTPNPACVSNSFYDCMGINATSVCGDFGMLGEAVYPILRRV